MKKYLFLVLLFIGSVEAYSQIEKGTFLLGGSGSISYHSSNQDFALSLQPSISYLITDHIAIGAFVPFFTNFNNTFWGFNPSVRYYFSSKSDKSFYAFTAINITKILEINNTFYSNPLMLGIGHVWFLNKSIGLTTHLACGTDFEIFDVKLFVGLNIYFRNKK